MYGSTVSMRKTRKSQNCRGKSVAREVHDELGLDDMGYSAVADLDGCYWLGIDRVESHTRSDGLDSSADLVAPSEALQRLLHHLPKKYAGAPMTELKMCACGCSGTVAV